MSAPEAFAYSKSVAPMMCAFVALASIELVVVHFLLSFWSQTAAIILSVISLGSILWLVALLRSFGRLPVLVGTEGVTMRLGTLKSVNVEPERLAGLRRDFTAESLKKGGVLNLAMIAYPNVIVDFTEPLPARSPVSSIAHRLDDPAGFEAAVERLLRSRVPG